MNCPNCGSKNPENEKFCQICGTTLPDKAKPEEPARPESDSRETPAAEVTVAEKPVVETRRTPASAPKSPGAQVDGALSALGGVFKKLLNNKKLLMISGGALVAVIIAIVLIVTLSGGGRDIKGYYYIDGDVNNAGVYFSGDGRYEEIDPYDGTVYPGTYRIDGDRIIVSATLFGLSLELTYTIIDDDTLVDDFGDTYSRVTGGGRGTRSSEDPYAYDPAAFGSISGDYYLYGDHNNDQLHFSGDGEYSIYYSSNGTTSSGTYYIDGDTIYVSGTVYHIDYYTLTIIDEDTLEDNYGDPYTRMGRNAASTSPTYEYMDIDPNARLNSNASVEMLRMYVPYPNTIFEHSYQDDYSVTLVSLDSAAYYTVEALDEYVPVNSETGSYSRNEMIALKDAVLDGFRRAIPGVTILDDNYISEQSMAYFKITYEMDGETRYRCVVFNARTVRYYGTLRYFSFTIDCPYRQMDDYMALFNRMRGEISTIR